MKPELAEIRCARCGTPMLSRLPWPPQTADNDELEVCDSCVQAIAEGEEP
jgi:hypothetical protein